MRIERFIMKYTQIYSILILLFSSLVVSANDANYNNLVNLKDKIIRNGDKIAVVDSAVAILGGGNNLVNALNLGVNEKINVSLKINNNSYQENIALKLHGGGQYNLGTGSTVDFQTGINSGELQNTAISLQNTNFKANQLTIDASVRDDTLTKTKVAGITATNSKVDLGTGSKINVFKVSEASDNDRNSYAVILKNTELTAEALALNTQKEGSQIGGFFVEGASILDLKNSSVVKTSGNPAIYVHTNQGEQPATLKSESNLTINVNGLGSGININGDARITLKNGANISTANGSGILTTPNGTTSLVADHLNVTTQGDYSALDLLGTTDVKIDQGTFSSDGSKATVFLAPFADMGESSTVEMKNTNIVSKNSTAIKLLQSSDLNIENTRIDVQASNTINYGITAEQKAKLTGKNTIIAMAGDGVAVSASGGSQIELSQGTQIMAPQIALLSDNKNNQQHSTIKIQDKFNATGAILAGGESHINLNTAAGSAVTGFVSEFNNGRIDWSGTATQWTFKTGSNLNNLVTDNHKARLNSLSLVDSRVDMTQSSEYNTLDVNDLSGNMAFVMKSDIKDIKSDKIIVNHASSGNHTILVKNNGSAKTTGKEKIILVKTPDGTALFTGVKDVELGGYTYTVKRENNDANTTNWELSSSSEPSITTTGQGGGYTLFSNYLVNYMQMRTLTDRLGDLRLNTDQSGAWLRSYGGKIKSKNIDRLGQFSMSYNGVQLGYDYPVYATETGNLYLGGTIGYLDSDNDLLNGTGKSHSYDSSIYLTYLNNHQFYLDAIVKAGRISNSFQVLDTEKNRVEAKDKVNNISASIEVGKRFNLDSANHWYLEPQAQYIWSNIEGGKYKSSNGLTIRTNDQESNIARVGLIVGYENSFKNNPLVVYAKVDYLKEFSGEYVYHLNENKENLNLKSHWYDYGLGITTNLNKKHHLFAEIKRTHGKKFNEDYRYNVGYRFNF